MANLADKQSNNVTVGDDLKKPYENEKLEANKKALDNMNEEMHGSKEFTLQEDFYALCYISYLKTNATKYNLSRKRQSRFFYSVLWVCMLQAALLYLALNELIFLPHSKGVLTFKVYGYETFMA
jgi:hypothetical protein